MGEPLTRSDLSRLIDLLSAAKKPNAYAKEWDHVLLLKLEAMAETAPANRVRGVLNRTAKAQFRKLVNRVSAPGRGFDRNIARLEMNKFVAKHGDDVCRAEFEKIK